jgi:hypothetical protein
MSPKVAIVGGGPVIGPALESLLESTGYRAHFLPASVIDNIDQLLSDTDLLVLAPALSAERRKALLEALLGQPGAQKIPVLELLPANGKEDRTQEGSVLWPCSVEELKRAIDALLA